MGAILPVFYLVLLVGAMLLGLALLATGVVLLLKLKNKLAGGLAIAIGAIFTTFPIFIFLAVNISPLVHG